MRRNGAADPEREFDMKRLFNVNWRRSILLAGTLLFAVVAYSAGQSDGKTESGGHGALPPQWHPVEKETLKNAAAGKKLVVMMFSASWCPPCREMKAKVLPAENVQQALKDWQAVYVDADKEEDLSRRYEIQGLPTFVFLGPDGKEINREVGYTAAGDFAYKLKSHQAYATRYVSLLDQSKAEPANAAVHKQLGDILTGVGKYGEAETQYAAGQRLDPNNKTGVHADLLFVRATQLATSDSLKAGALLRELGQKYPSSPRAADGLFMRGLLLLDGSKHDEAGKLFKEYLAKYPAGRYADGAKNIVEELAKQKT